MKKSYLPVGVLAFVFAAINACSGTDGAEIPETGDANGEGLSDARASETSGETADATETNDAGKDAAVKDGAVKDGTTKDGAKDTSSEATVVTPTYAPEGSSCVMGSIETKACGLCGVSDRACLPADGGWVWGSWGFCQREVSGPDVCDPAKVYADAACGNCGTTKQICQNDCRFAKGLACSEPKDSCQPGLSEFVIGLSCANPTEGRTRTCNTQCAWDVAATCTTPPPNPNQIVISAVGSVKKTYHLDPAKVSKPPIAGVCPASLDSVEVAASYIELKNTSSLTATVSAWYEEDVASTEYIYPNMAVYDGPFPPSASDPVALRACVGRVVDDCFADECPDYYAGLVLGDHGTITIAPGKSVTLYVGGDVQTKQPYILNVRTDSLK